MICFDVRVNGQRVALAGVGDDGVLHAIVDWVCRENRPPNEQPVLDLSVGGLVADAHLRWVEDKPLHLGDRVEILVVEGDPDPPTREDRDDRALVEAAERTTYERLKRKYSTDPA